jgi:hypothetical protein
VPQPYGGYYYVQSHFAEGGIVANPLALVTFFDNLEAAYNGATTGPLTPATVQEMVSKMNGTQMNGPSGPWWGLGWEVMPAPGTTDVPGEWTKNGGLPGTSSLLVKLDNDTSFAYVINENDGDSVGVFPDAPFAAELEADVEAALRTTVTTLTSSPAPSNLAEPVTLTATVAGFGFEPTGTVTFLDGSTVLGTVPLANGVASFTTSKLLVANHLLTAVYSGDGNFDGSTSAPLLQVVFLVPLPTVPPPSAVRPNNVASFVGAVPGSGALFPDPPPLVNLVSGTSQISYTGTEGLQPGYEAAPPDKPQSNKVPPLPTALDAGDLPARHGAHAIAGDILATAARDSRIRFFAELPATTDWPTGEFGLPCLRGSAHRADVLFQGLVLALMGRTACADRIAGARQGGRRESAVLPRS